MAASDHLSDVQFSRETSESGRAHFTTAKMGDSTIGYSVVKDGGDHAELSMVKVNREHRGQGLGRQLVSRAVDEFGDREMRLRVEPADDKPMSATRLRSFYGEFGFKQAKKHGMVRPANSGRS